MTSPATSEAVRACWHALALLGARATWDGPRDGDPPARRLDVALGARWRPWGAAGPAVRIAPAVADAVLLRVGRHADAIKRALDPRALADALGVTFPVELLTPAGSVAVAELAAVRAALDRDGVTAYHAHHDAHAARGALPWLAALLALDDCAQPDRAAVRTRLRARAGLADRPP